LIQFKKEKEKKKKMICLWKKLFFYLFQKNKTNKMLWTCH